MRANTASTMLLGRSTVLSIIAVAGALSFSAMEAQAGVILPWVQEGAATELSLPIDGAGSSSAPEQPVSDSRQERESHKVPGMKAFDGLAETGGASAPSSGTAGPTSSVAIAILDLPATPLVTRAFGYLREHTLQLPQPPPGELLDPPKAG